MVSRLEKVGQASAKTLLLVIGGKALLFGVLCLAYASVVDNRGLEFTGLLLILAGAACVASK